MESNIFHYLKLLVDQQRFLRYYVHAHLQYKHLRKSYANKWHMLAKILLFILPSESTLGSSFENRL
jgi:hypothetical protein